MGKSTNQINAFINSIDDAQRLYVAHCLSFARKMQDVIEKFGVSRQDFCREMEISPAIYHRFIKGGYNYDVRNMATFQAFHYRLLSLKSEEENKEAAEVMKFPKYKHNS